MNRRIERINQLLKKEIGNILLRTVGVPNALITITEVDTSDPLTDARVYVSVLPADKTEEIFRILEKEIYGIQQTLNKRLKMRPIPKIIFKKEKRTWQAESVEKAIEDLKKEEK
jgi:ribosome-binding factor A